MQLIEELKKYYVYPKKIKFDNFIFINISNNIYINCLLLVIIFFNYLIYSFMIFYKIFSNLTNDFVNFIKLYIVKFNLFSMVLIILRINV